MQPEGNWLGRGPVMQQVYYQRLLHTLWLIHRSMLLQTKMVCFFLHKWTASVAKSFTSSNSFCTLFVFCTIAFSCMHCFRLLQSRECLDEDNINLLSLCLRTWDLTGLEPSIYFSLSLSLTHTQQARQWAGKCYRGRGGGRRRRRRSRQGGLIRQNGIIDMAHFTEQAQPKFICTHGATA